MSKADVIDVLEHIAQLLEIQGENPFKVRAYRTAVQTLDALDEDLRSVIAEKRLGKLKGIGKTIEEKVTVLVETGSLPYYEDLKASVPDGLIEMLKIPGLGPKKAKAAHEKLGIDSLADLETAARDGSLAKLSGFGKKTAAKILDGIAFAQRSSGQHLLGEAVAIAEAILDAIRAHKSVKRAEIAGSLRRGKEVVKDVDIVASTSDPKAVMGLFVGLPQVEKVTGHGESKSSVLVRAPRGSISVDLRACDEKTYPFLLRHFTGSKEHNIAMRQRAIRMGFSLSEWGLFKGESKSPAACKDEAAVFRKLGMDFVPPELREDRQEIDAAEAGELPRLIELGDIRAELHQHTTDSDGRTTIEEMAEANRRAGYVYMGIADHSRAAAYAGGLSPDELENQARRIDRLNEKYGGEFTVLKSSEVDILRDGALDFDDATLRKLDYGVASVHSLFNLPEAEMTARIVKAIEHPAVTILGHLTGRLLLDRDGYALAIDEVLSAAAENHVAVEINANPHRLDLDWRYVKAARDRGAKLSINTDAHAPENLAYLRFGVGIARKGWLEKNDVINTYTLKQFRKFVSWKR